ncbi:MAG TPA: rod shape-determining protein RodA [Gaiellaceae bacterium]|jgi:rod shape determining protein RodA|nr:rod shape-determining protein RodA [Gaiellaceae bacterium]
MAVEYASGARSATRARRREAGDVASVLRRLDWVLLGAVLGVAAYGLWAIAGITRHDVPGNPNYYLVRQGIFVAVGLVGLGCAVLIDPAWYGRRWRLIYAGTILVILVVYAAGPVTRGTKRWLELGPFRFQPSEFGKVLFVIALAGFIAGRTKRLGEVRTTVEVVGLASIPILLVFAQPDVGTAMVYGAALGAVLFVAGTPWSHLAALAAAVILLATTVLWLAPAAGVHVLKQYQGSRLTGFLHPDSDPGGATYNITQSKNAIGAGQLRGRGVNGATQTTLHFLPEHATDFVFSSLSEERGFVGASILLGLYLLVVWRGFRIVMLARDAFTAITAGGIVFALLFQIFVNIGMTMGIAPITGIPLPFLSVGGSSMISNLIAIGVLLAIHARARAGRR